MAIVGSQPRIEVTIKSNGTTLTEYENNNDEADGPLAEKTVVRYIETVPDVSFSIHATVRKGTPFNCDYLFFGCQVDGVFVTPSLCDDNLSHEKDWSRNESYLTTRDETRQLYRRSYKFKEIETGEKIKYHSI